MNLSRYRGVLARVLSEFGERNFCCLNDPYVLCFHEPKKKVNMKNSRTI